MTSSWPALWDHGGIYNPCMHGYHQPDCPYCNASDQPVPMSEFLSSDELEAMNLLATFAGKMRRIIGDGPCARGDWAEAADKIHQLQAVIMAQAASRAYPDLFRPLGGRADEAEVTA